MLLTEDVNPANYAIKQITLNAVYINDVIYTHSLIVMPHTLISPWQPKVLQELCEEDFETLLTENLDVVLLGVGEHGGRLPLKLYYALLKKGLVIECMSLASAARTYRILSAEGRRVAAALLF